MTIWFCSDHHLFHKNVLSFKGDDGSPYRPFETVGEMNQTILKNHNALVKAEDKVYFLGDVTWKTGPEFDDFFSKFHGKKRLIVGNHDDVKKIGHHFQKISIWRVFKGGDISIPFTASHVPLHPESIKGSYNVHGHTHVKDVEDDRYVNISMEKTGFRPVSLQGIQNALSQLEK